MRGRRIGIFLVVLGALGFLGLGGVMVRQAARALPGSTPLPVPQATLAPFWGPGFSGPEWMWEMHRWMHGLWGAPWGPGAGPGATPPSAGAQEVRVRAREFSFDPREIALEAGKTYNVVLVNEGGVLHDLTVPALGFRVVAGPGQTVSASLTPRSQGRYPFFCSVPGHAEAGMVGTLVVKEG